jgi:DNA polymerase III delta prime subunit
MAKTPESYRTVVPDLDVIVSIKRLNDKEFIEYYKELLLMMGNPELGVLSVQHYKQIVVSDLLIPDNDSKVDTDDDNLIDSFYSAIIAIYPVFILEYLCGDINAIGYVNSITKSDFDEKTVANFVASKGFFGSGGKLSDPSTSIEMSMPPITSRVELNELDSFLRSKIMGQDHVIDEVLTSLKVMAAGLTGHSSFFFIGPTGVGKTELSKLLAEQLDTNYFKVNCAEYASAHEYAKLIGSPPGYVGHTEKSLLFEKAEQSNQWVFLFDEIEKAHHKLYNFLLSILDDGTCTDNLGRELDFTNSIFIFTSNLGIKEINSTAVGFGSDSKTSEEVAAYSLEAVKKEFNPEFINRVDSFSTFNSLSPEIVEEIARIQLSDLPIKVNKTLVKYVAKNGYSKEYGARNINRFIKKNVTPVVADAILDGILPKKGDYYNIRVTKKGVKIINTATN